MQPPLGILGLFGSSVRLFVANFGALFPLVLAPLLAAAVATFLASPTPTGPAGLGAPSVAEGLTVVALIVLGFIFGGALCLASLDIALGKRHGVGDYLRQAWRHAGPLVALGLLVSVAIGVGAVFLILPGLYLAARFLPYVPAIVFENAGWSGLGRAQALTEGYRWPLVGAVVLLGLAAVVISVPAVLVSAATGSSIVAILVETFVQAVIYSLSLVFSALVYLRLREIKEATPARK